MVLLIMDIILNYIYPPPVLWRRYSFTWRKLCLSRGFLVFLASIWLSLSLELDVYVKMSFACLAPCDSNVAVFGKCCWLLCMLYIPLLVLVWLCSHFWFHHSLASHRRSWKIRLFPKPVGRIAKTSFQRTRFTRQISWSLLSAWMSARLHSPSYWQ